MPAAPLRWIFDELPPSGARRGGYAAEHAFAHQLGTFVREVCQNANDQALAAPRVRLGLRELAGDELAALQAALRWPSLRAHLSGAGASGTPSGRRIAEFLTELERTGTLMVATVEDHGTVGLTGDEDGERSHFRALCKDTLFSVKRSDDAGGSYGLGKSVLWTFSGLATVLFASTPSELPAGLPAGLPASTRGPRVIGRAELPYHEVEGLGFTGPGWFGREVERGDGRVRAESIWAKQAARVAAALGLERPPDTTGTSILVLGFRDPTAEQPAALAELEAQFRREAAWWFWPAMQADQRGLVIEVGDRAVDPAAPDLDNALAPFVECWRQRDQAKPRLEQPGDVARVPITIELPRPRSGGRKLRGQVDLLVRLAGDDQDEGPLVRRLACFRGPGMVVAYHELGRTAGLRPFHAVLACGRARDPADPSEADDAIERFLRDAEPPGHDAWEPSATVRDHWSRGYGQVLPRLWSSVHAALRELLSAAPVVGVAGPERLRKRFPLGRRPSPVGKGPSAFSFRQFHAEFVEHEWRFRGVIEPELGARPWRASVSLHHLGDDGAEVAALPIAAIEVEPSEVRCAIVDGIVELEAPLGILHVELRGRSLEPEPELEHAALGLRVYGELYEPPPHGAGDGSGDS